MLSFKYWYRYMYFGYTFMWVCITYIYNIYNSPYAIFAARLSLHSWRVANVYGCGSLGHQGTAGPQTHRPAFAEFSLSFDRPSPIRLQPERDIFGPWGQWRRQRPGISINCNEVIRIVIEFLKNIDRIFVFFFKYILILLRSL